ncbi:MAG: LacI family DNA-binding transcriptional regulator [Paracoccaceae bacterium]
MATIYDVANSAGVSPKTVSRVLNGDGPVGAKTREAVEKAMAELGYVPSNAARMMRSNRSGLIGLITGAISSSSMHTEVSGLPDTLILQGIQQVLGDSGMTLMIADTGGDREKVAPLMRTFLQHRVEGLLYVADYHREVQPRLAGAGVPVVLANCYDTKGTPAIVPDDEAGQRALVTRLIEAGHRRIGFLTLDASMRAAALRHAGYRAAFDAAGLPIDDALVVEAQAQGAEDNASRLEEAVDRLLALRPRPTVICTGNDAMAMQLYGVLRSRGIRVPEDISVAGFDDHRVIAETLYPPLTTAVLPYLDIGRRAARRLLGLIAEADPDTANPVLVPGPVAWRSSVTDLTQSSPK